MSSQQRIDTQSNCPLIIGYYPFRAKGQVARLLCQYLHVPYVDLLFNPDEWTKYKDNNAKDWIIKDLPFLIDEDFTITGCASILQYIIEKTGRTDMFGRTIEDKVKIDSFKSKHDMRNAILGLICVNRPNQNQPQDPRNCQNYWTFKIEPILFEYESECQEDNWYLGYITIMDFFFYELFNLLERMYTTKILKFKKLNALRNRVGALKQISEYENSGRAIRQYCPVRYFSKFKEEKLRSGRMDLE